MKFATTTRVLVERAWQLWKEVPFVKKILLTTGILLLVLSSYLVFKRQSSFDFSLVPVGAENMFQYVDHKGKTIINPQFKLATVFSGATALVKSDGNESAFGYIGKDGKYRIAPKYKRATIFSEGLAWAEEENDLVVLDEDGTVMFKLDGIDMAGPFSDGLAPIRDEESHLFGFVDTKGQVRIPPQFKHADSFSQGLAAVRAENGQWGYINTSGGYEINPQFGYAADFRDGRAIAAIDNQTYGVIDSDGQYIINPQFESIEFDGDMFLVKQGGKYGWCDDSGTFEINPQFQQALPFNGSGLAAVTFGDKWGYINQSGKVKVNPQFDRASVFIDGFSVVRVSRKYGFIDDEGRYLANPQFDKIDLGTLERLAGGSGSEYHWITLR